jgi:type IV secretory pathway VirB10-like protein
LNETLGVVFPPPPPPPPKNKKKIRRRRRRKRSEKKRKKRRKGKGKKEKKRKTGEKKRSEKKKKERRNKEFCWSVAAFILKENTHGHNVGAKRDLTAFVCKYPHGPKAMAAGLTPVGPGPDPRMDGCQICSKRV